MLLIMCLPSLEGSRVLKVQLIWRNEAAQGSGGKEETEIDSQKFEGPVPSNHLTAGPNISLSHPL